MNVLSSKKVISIIICSIIVFGVIFVLNIEKKLNGNEVCIVQFETNGGTFTEGQEIKCGSVISQPKSPQKVGFLFKYWEYNGEEYDFSKPVKSDTILKPFYEKEENIEVIVVSFDTKVEYKIDDVEIKKGEKLEKPISPVMEGFKFAGWYFQNKEFDFSNPIYKNITLEAKWAYDISDVKTKENNGTNVCKFASGNNFRDNYDVNLYNGKIIKVNIQKAFNQNWYYNENCEIRYYTSNSNVATVDKTGLISVINEGIVTISSCIYNKKDNKKLDCFKGIINSKKTNKDFYDEPKISYDKLKGTWYPKYSNVSYIKFSDFQVIEETNYQTFTYEFYGINENNLSYSCQSGICENLYDRNVKKFTDESIISFEEKYSPKIVNNKLILSINGKSLEFSREKAVVSIKSFSLDKTSATVKVGDSLTVSSYVLPNNATYNHIIWESSNESIAKITNREYLSYTENGSVTVAYISAISPGIVTFTARTRDGKYIKEFILTVNG